jgi:EAL domain-containing protein (putative c-di-GMP-specific phosphodiesterase class I)/CheY-like chemotaxis protein
MSETRSSSSPAADKAAPAIAAPPLSPADAPLCFVVDEDPSIRHFLSLILHGSGIDSMEFAEGKQLREALAQHLPDLVFYNIAIESVDAVESMIALGNARFRGPVQLMSNRGGAVLEHVKSVGAEHLLSMLPVLKKPFETDAIVKIIHELRLGTPPSVAARLGLDEALANDWIEFWYQPKINLRRKQLAGAEAYARARHPQHGIVLPGAFMPGAGESALVALSERALTSALKTGASFARLGINLRLTINIPVNVLVKLSIEDIVRSHHPSPQEWPGLIVDVPEEQIVNDLALARELMQRLERHNISLAIDDFGRGYSLLSRMDELPFAEIKLDRAFVADCGTDRVNAPLCKMVIDLAHNFGRAAVAMGIEKATDAVALVSMGCDFGEGFLLGQPMPEERFISLLRQRAATQGRELPAQ